MSRHRSNSDSRHSYDSEIYESPEERLEKRLEDYQFEGTRFLDLSNIGITNIPYLPNDLEELYCGNNKLKYIPPLPLTLKRLVCSGNKNLKSLPPLPPSLEVLKCHNCSLEKLPSLPSTLLELEASNNKLKSLPPLSHSLLSIHVDNNYLISIPSLPTNLRLFNCSNNMIKELPELPDSILYLYCYNNKLIDFPLTLPISILGLSADNNTFPNRDFKKESLKEYHDKICDFLTKKRISERVSRVKEELIEKAWHPDRVCKWIESGIDITVL
jgi:Leucine-rich repeat (LRR) protein